MRGIDDGFLYVIDGVPVYERLDQLSGLAPDLSTVESINVITGYMPAEFGYKAGGVIDVRSKSAAADWEGLAQFARGSDDDTHGAASAGGPLNRRLSLTAGGSRATVRRASSIRSIPTTITTRARWREAARNSSGSERMPTSSA